MYPEYHFTAPAPYLEFFLLFVSLMASPSFCVSEPATVLYNYISHYAIPWGKQSMCKDMFSLNGTKSA